MRPDRTSANNSGPSPSSMGEGVCAVSERGEVTFINPAARAMLGWTAGADPDAELDLDLDYHAGSGAGLGADEGPRRAPDCVRAPARRAMATGTMVTSYDSRFERADGSTFQVAFTASPIVTGDVATGAVIVFRDITERKAFEEQLALHAFHDALTGLPNRRLFLDHLDLPCTALCAATSVTPCSSSTSTGSRSSTTASATAAATRCWSPSPTGCGCRSAPATSWPGSAGDEFTILLSGMRDARGRGGRGPSDPRRHADRGDSCPTVTRSCPA